MTVGSDTDFPDISGTRPDTSDFKSRAFELAVRIGCEIDRFEERNYWRCGMRGSADQYGKSFPDHFAAAIHFLSTREGQDALKRSYAEDHELIRQCYARTRTA